MATTIVPGDRHYMPDAARPDIRIRFAIEEATGKVVIQTTGDGGQNWSSISSELPSNAAPGWVPSVGPNNTIVWKPISSIAFQSSSATSDTTGGLIVPRWTDFSYPAQLEKDTDFGFLEIPAGIFVKPHGVQLSVFGPSANEVRVRFYNVTTAQYVTPWVTLPVGAIYATQIFGTSDVDVSVINPRERIVARVTWTGSDPETGSFLVARLLLDDAS